MIAAAGPHPLNALFTAVRISPTVICPSWLASPASQAETGETSSAIFTMVSNSSTVTWPSPSQSPTQTPGAAVGVMVGVAVGGGGLDVEVGELPSVGVGVAVETAMLVGVTVAHVQHPAMFGLLVETQASLVPQAGFWMHAPQAEAKHPARIVGHGTQLSLQ